MRKNILGIKNHKCKGPRMGRLAWPGGKQVKEGAWGEVRLEQGWVQDGEGVLSHVRTFCLSS